MITKIIELVPIFVISISSAYFSYLLDSRFDYVWKMNNKLKLNNTTNIVFSIGIVGIIIGICCYSAVNYKSIGS